MDKLKRENRDRGRKLMKKLKKFLVLILILLMLNNFILNISFSIQVFAADAGENAADAGESSTDVVGGWIEDILGTVVGLLTIPLKLVGLACRIYD